MPVVLQATDTKVVNEGEGWQELGLADVETFGEAAMVARRWLLQPGAQGPERVHGGADQLLYVIGGGGTAVVNNTSLPLDEESVLWLEPGEHYYFVAGMAGLDILQGYAEGGVE